MYLERGEILETKMWEQERKELIIDINNKNKNIYKESSKKEDIVWGLK